MLGLVLRPRSRAISINRLIPSLIHRRVMDPHRRHPAPRKQEKTSGFVTAHSEGGLGKVICAETQNLASRAISSATSAARGISIIVPTR